DTMTYDPKTDSYRQLVQGLVLVLEDDRPALDLFFMPSLRFSSELLLLNQRDEAGRYEPMELGENASAFRRVRTVQWAQYPYSVFRRTPSLSIHMHATPPPICATRLG